LDFIDQLDTSKTTYDHSLFSGNSTAPKYGISETSCSSFPFSWNDEYEYLGYLIDDTKNYPLNDPRIIGWGINEEFYSFGLNNSSYLAYMENLVSAYAYTIGLHDSVSPGKMPLYTTETRNMVHDGYSSNAQEGEIIDTLSTDKINMMSYFDYIFEDFSYYADIDSGFQNLDWEDAVYIAESTMRYTDLGYCRYIQARNGQRNGITYTPSLLANNPYNLDRFQFLPYSSWAVGGQGVIIWSLSHPDAQGWFEYCHSIAKAADSMKNYLLSEPELSIPVIAYDSLASTNHSERIRFILRRDQNNPTNQYLLLFCNFANDNLAHSTYIHFPSHAISNVSQVPNTPLHWTTPQITDNGHTFVYTPNAIASKDVYARAFFVTLN